MIKLKKKFRHRLSEEKQFTYITLGYSNIMTCICHNLDFILFDLNLSHCKMIISSMT